MIRAFQDVKLYLSVTAVTPTDTTDIPKEQYYRILESRMDGVRDPVNTPHGSLMV